MIRNDSGYALPLTVLTVTLMAYMALIAGRTFGIQLRASIQERLIIEERLTTRNAEHIMDAWMAHPVFSEAITENNAGVGLWRKPDGSLSCTPPADTTCWQFTVNDPTPAPGDNPKLRGGEAEQDTRDITVEIRSGCVGGGGIDRCQRTSEIIRTYERAVFAQYQLHYHSHDVPPGAIEDTEMELTNAVAAANPSLTEDQVDARVNDLTADPPVAVSTDATVKNWLNLIDLLETSDQEVVFADGDTFNGPVRYSGPGTVRYCSESPGAVQFRRLEAKDPGDPSNVCSDQDAHNYQWCTDDDCTTSDPWNLPAHADKLEDDKGDDLKFPAWQPSDEPNPDAICSIIDTTQLGDCGQDIDDGDVISDTGDITVRNLRLDNKSVTVLSGGDIIVTTDTISTTGPNSVGGPHVIALIAGGNVILDPSLGLTDITFTNVAILARDGAVFARDWHQSCSPCPTFKLEGSAAMKHLGLYGQVGPPQTGWEKDFTYPTDDPATPDTNEAFWRARPPWWPGYDSYPIPEWEPA